jgi:hypothetical protein
MSYSDNHQRLVRLSPLIREAIAFASAERELTATPALTTGHMLLGLLRLPAIQALYKHDIVLERVRPLVYAAVQYGEVGQRAAEWSRELATLFEVFSTKIQDNPDVPQEVLLLRQLIRQPNTISSQILSSLGITIEGIQP